MLRTDRFRCERGCKCATVTRATAFRLNLHWFYLLCICRTICCTCTAYPQHLTMLMYYGFAVKKLTLDHDKCTQIHSKSNQWSLGLNDSMCYFVIGPLIIALGEAGSTSTPYTPISPVNWSIWRWSWTLTLFNKARTLCRDHALPLSFSGDGSLSGGVVELESSMWRWSWTLTVVVNVDDQLPHHMRLSSSV